MQYLGPLPLTVRRRCFVGHRTITLQQRVAHEFNNLQQASLDDDHVLIDDELCLRLNSIRLGLPNPQKPLAALRRSSAVLTNHGLSVSSGQAKDNTLMIVCLEYYIGETKIHERVCNVTIFSQ